MPSKASPTTKKRDANFQRTEKIALIKAIEARPCLWRVTERKKIFGKVAVKKAWQSVADELNKDVHECRSAWYSLRNSLRYHRDKLAKSQDTDIVDWQFAEHMAFLPVTSLKKRTKSRAFVFVDSPSCSSPQSDISEESVMDASSEEPNWVHTEDDLEANTSSVYSHVSMSEESCMDASSEEPNSVHTEDDLEANTSSVYSHVSMSKESCMDASSEEPNWVHTEDDLEANTSSVYSHVSMSKESCMDASSEEPNWVHTEDDLEASTTSVYSHVNMSEESCMDASSEEPNCVHTEDDLEANTSSVYSHVSMSEKSCMDASSEEPNWVHTEDDLEANTSSVYSHVSMSEKSCMDASSEEPNCVHTEDDSEANTSSVYSHQSKASKIRKVEEASGDNGNKIKTRSIFPFWDELLGKLPEDIATATEVEITNLIYLKVRSMANNRLSE